HVCSSRYSRNVVYIEGHYERYDPAHSLRNERSAIENQGHIHLRHLSRESEAVTTARAEPDGCALAVGTWKLDAPLVRGFVPANALFRRNSGPCPHNFIRAHK